MTEMASLGHGRLSVALSDIEGYLGRLPDQSARDKTEVSDIRARGQPMAFRPDCEGRFDLEWRPSLE
jgi:hypothetical protein